MKIAPAYQQYLDSVENGVSKPFSSYLGPKQIINQLTVPPKVIYKNSYQKLLALNLNYQITSTREAMDALKMLFGCQYSQDHELNVINGRKFKEYKYKLASASYGKNSIKEATSLTSFINANFILDKDDHDQYAFMNMYKHIERLENELLYSLHNKGANFIKPKKQFESEVKKVTPIIHEGFRLADRTKRKQMTFEL